MDSPAGPKIRRRKAAEPTVTIHTKAAMDEVYDIFNQTLNVTPVAEEDGTEEADDDSDDDATSMGDSTGTGHMSTTLSECGDETGDYTASSKADPDATTRHTIDSEYSDVTNAVDADTEEDISVVNIDVRDLDIREPEMDSLPAGDFEDNADPQTDEEYDFVDQPADPVSYRTKGMNRLPFMTPIVEKTESSIGAVTAAGARTHMSMKTPSRIPRDAPFQEDDTPMSSPLQELETKNEIRVRIPQPDLPKPNSNASLGPASIAGNSIKGKPSKGPVILDAQCNPMDPTLRHNILAEMHPPIATYGGFYSSLGSNAHKSSEIRKFVKSQTKGPLVQAPCLELPGSKRTYTVRRELGRGAYAPVYLVDSTPKDEEDGRNFGPQREAQEVIKMEDPPTPWEFYMIRQAKRRLGSSRPSASIVEAHEMHLFDDEGFLVEEYRNQGTLLEAINVCRGDGSTGGHMDELLVLFFSIEVFRTVEALHSKGLIHGDLKADNILLRLDSGAAPDASWAPRYRADGGDGWGDRGVVLIDFGRGVDMRQFRPDVQFIADWKTTDADCAEMREMRPWTFQADYHGLAGVVHSLLFGKYTETRAERVAGLGAGGATKTYAIKEGLKRYWQTGIWTDVFELLLNPMQHLEGEEGGRLPVVQGLRRARGMMEEYLEANGEKGQGLKPLLRRLEGSIRERRK
jgi:checkpoint serine/threonine-protein kinase